MMAVVEVHVSVFAPEGGQAICQALIRERVPTVPPVVDALREVDWHLVKEDIGRIGEEVVDRVLTQIDDYQVFLDARGRMPAGDDSDPDKSIDDDDDHNGNGNGNS